MTTATSRKDRRVLAAKTAKIYGIKGQESVDLHEAYNALARNEIGKAVQLALPITKSHPANRHAWIVMGGAALTQREGKTAKAFFGQALQARSDDPVALTGMSKAHLLSAEVEESVATARLAFEAGAEERGLVTMYMDLMSRLGRRLAAVDVLSPVVEKLNDAELCHTLGNMLLDADEPGKAARWYHAAYALDPKPEAHRIGHLRALLVECRFDEAEPFAQDLLQTAEDHDGVVNIYLLMLRVTGRRDEAEKLIQDTDFTTPEGYAQALGLMANIHQDRGNYDAARDSYQEAIHVTGHGGRLAKAYGVFLFRDGAYGEGAPHFAERFDQAQRGRIPLHNAAPENLEKLQHMLLMGEQGVGDQLAMLPLLRLAPLDPGAQVTFVADDRFGPLLAGNTLGIAHRDRSAFTSAPQQLALNQLVYLGDLSRYLEGREPSAKHGAYLRPDAARVAALREKYVSAGKGAPVIGLAWNSASLIGRLRSVALAEMLTALPEGALVVNLQYGDTSREVTEAMLGRPDLTFVNDFEIDQMADLAGFAAQIAAMDHVVTIDNTTAHMAGALGHGSAHALIPAGSECMWYWGRSGEADPWYGALTLHRQQAIGDWSEPLAEVRARLAP
ncbi:tetratricopeptide repeat protein [Albibacillus kandeliae]|uniref:hypothetical protein n=1 Tax=Albibacillus kandeliae TaxID=2174228 RepID=UPI000D692059|nr:hypothetical protein [Albibacillus kandeliae]